MRKRILPAVLLLQVAVLCFLAACAHLQPGADPLIVRAEQAETTAKSTADLVLNVEAADLGFWATNAPAFYDFAEWLKVPQTVDATNTLPRISAMIWSLNDVKDAYKSSGSQSNALYSAIVTLEAVAVQAVSWLNITTNHVPLPH